jgi:hypothetical protein
MNPSILWAIPIIVGVLTFFGGRSFERRKIAQENRLKLLEPIEQWIDRVSHLVGIVSEDLTAASQGLVAPIGYDPIDRMNTAKSLNEGKDKVVGILRSNIFSTRGTKTISEKLSTDINDLSQLIERDYLISNARLLEKYAARQDLRQEILIIVSQTSRINNLIQEIHSCISLLKTRFN